MWTELFAGFASLGEGFFLITARKQSATATDMLETSKESRDYKENIIVIDGFIVWPNKSWIQSKILQSFTVQGLVNVNITQIVRISSPRHI